MDEENRIAVLGDYDSIYGFASLGLSTFPVDNIEDASKTLRTLATSGYGIIDTGHHSDTGRQGKYRRRN